MRSQTWRRSLTSQDYSKQFGHLPFLHRRLSFQVTFHVARGAGGEAPSSNVAPTGPMETFFKEKAPTLLLQDLWKHF